MAYKIMATPSQKNTHLIWRALFHLLHSGLDVGRLLSLMVPLSEIVSCFAPRANLSASLGEVVSSF